MINSNDIGNLMHLYLEDIEPGQGTDQPEYLIKASAHLLNQTSDRNWLPVIVTETGKDQYQIIGNEFTYAVAEEAGLERVWCIIADDTDETATISRVLSNEEIPKTNLSKASREEILLALQYLKEQPNSLLKNIKPQVAANRIDEAPRQFWTDLNPVVNLKCGITRGNKLNALGQVFYLTPQPLPDIITDPNILNGMTATELRKIAKKRGMTGYSKLKKADLISVLEKA